MKPRSSAGRVERRRRFLDVVAERFAQARGVLDRGDAIGVDRDTGRRAARERDAQPARRLRHLVEPRPFGRRRRIRIARQRPGDRIEHRGAVAHAARHDVLDRKPAQALRRPPARR
jgi:hypothetical protein